MSDRRRVVPPRRWVVLCIIGAVGLAGAGAGCSGADELETPPTADAPAETSAPDETPGDGTSPDGTAPEDSVPAGSSPEDTSPAESSPDTAPAVPPEEAPDPSEPPDEGTSDEQGVDETAEVDDGEVDPVLVVFAVLGFVVLVAIAARWMLRRDDPDDEIGRPDRDDWPDDQMSL